MNRNRKARLASLCLILCLCLLLCACSQPPSAQPPDYTLMSWAEIQLTQGEIAESSLFTVYYGEKQSEYYLYTLKDGIEQTKEAAPDSKVSFSELTYGQFVPLLRAVMKQLEADNLGMTKSTWGEPEIRYTPGKGLTGAQIAAMEPKTSGSVRYTEYYIYSIGEDRLVKGDHVLTGRDALGMLSVYNHSVGTVHDGTILDIEYVYILIAD